MGMTSLAYAVPAICFVYLVGLSLTGRKAV